MRHVQASRATKTASSVWFRRESSHPTQPQMSAQARGSYTPRILAASQNWRIIFLEGAIG